MFFFSLRCLWSFNDHVWYKYELRGNISLSRHIIVIKKFTNLQMVWAELQRRKKPLPKGLLFAVSRALKWHQLSTHKAEKIDTHVWVKVKVLKFKRMLISVKSIAFFFLQWPDKVSSVPHTLLLAGYMQYFLSSPPPCGHDSLRIHAVVKDISGL